MLFLRQTNRKTINILLIRNNPFEETLRIIFIAMIVHNLEIYTGARYKLKIARLRKEQDYER